MTNKLKEMKLKTLKNKYAFACPLFALGLVLGSCSQEESDEFIPNKETQKNTLTFTANPVAAETKGISTKVSITPQRNNDVLNWEENDKVTFYFLGDNYEDKKTYTVSVDGSNASITGGKPSDPDEYKILALYPDRSSNFSSSATILTIPDALTQTEDNSHLKDYIYMYARPETTIKIDDEGNATGGDIALDFTLLTSLLRFEIENTSSSDVTLKSVTISYPNDDAKLYSRVALDEENSVVYPANGSNSHASMTLNFSDLLLEAGEDTQGNLCVFPTTGASALNIDLSVQLSDGNDINIPYEIVDIQNLESEARYIIPITFGSGDLTIEPGSRTLFLDGNEYMTFRYHDGSKVTTWMVTPLKDEYGRVIYANNFDSCPDGWYMPTVNDMISLSEVWSTYNLGQLFETYKPSIVGYSNDQPYDGMGVIIGGDKFFLNAMYSWYNIIIPTGEYNSVYVYDFDTTGHWRYRYPIRCVK